jgi:hypothetical protein
MGKGYILKSVASSISDCYVDAYFSGTWTVKPLADPSRIVSFCCLLSLVITREVCDTMY